jgi:hypothetical protein
MTPFLHTKEQMEYRVNAYKFQQRMDLKRFRASGTDIRRLLGYTAVYFWDTAVYVWDTQNFWVYCE